jgi:hypothetical protein
MTTAIIAKIGSLSGQPDVSCQRCIVHNQVNFEPMGWNLGRFGAPNADSRPEDALTALRENPAWEFLGGLQIRARSRSQLGRHDAV